jgi:hypothetical protein
MVGMRRLVVVGRRRIRAEEAGEDQWIRVKTKRN